ncbi:glyoxylase-like metal-dependent hydrolase (beta-lactamase superfamily II) [Arthrobacter stackebrandtii]|uniref:Glyoxylase-like metal-dependent hydrolase (Beta-lactamase superfamily II) n=1 Tax=Arthrobacter stackebrandtii TaxID=272161 RepID=A0ABS4YTU6_9MICC|nr:MBL fold metallo-hydrolase [Arthrobacter stackebrandtii]MBP2412217.1 glyoxylase-like metal-dependent hydrolase (beta-lactamase superfamily II) [Arthrobacter stackebrandtii]PYH02003.1 hypothetical protein CVV67_00735 [Arthrobacter stackebrandtii]
MSWTEVGAGVFVQRYEAGDINIAAVVGPHGVTVADTRGSGAEAQEVLDDVARQFELPVVAAINTHAHYDHSFGNATFAGLGVPVVGHHRIPAHYAAFEAPRLAAWQADPSREPDKHWHDVVLAPPTDSIHRPTTLAHSGRDIACIPVSAGHTDTDLAVLVPDARVWLLGDLVEESGPPMFGSGSRPLGWPGAVDEILLQIRPGDVVVPGHGRIVDRDFVVHQASALHSVAGAIRSSHAAGHTVDEAVQAAALPWPDWMLRSAFEEGFSELGAAPQEVR